MAAPDDEERFRRFMEEISAGSRDYSTRKILDQRVRAYFKSLDDGRIDEMARWYADDVIGITNIQMPGTIWKGKEEVIASHKGDLAARARLTCAMVTVPTWVIVDRGRITCRIERFFTRRPMKIIRKLTSVMVFDLDSTGHVKRLEHRKINVSIEDRPIEELVRESRAKQEDMQIYLQA